MFWWSRVYFITYMFWWSRVKFYDPMILCPLSSLSHTDKRSLYKHPSALNTQCSLLVSSCSIYLTIYLSIYLSIYISTYLFIYIRLHGNVLESLFEPLGGSYSPVYKVLVWTPGRILQSCILFEHLGGSCSPVYKVLVWTSGRILQSCI